MKTEAEIREAEDIDAAQYRVRQAQAALHVARKELAARKALAKALAHSRYCEEYGFKPMKCSQPL